MFPNLAFKRLKPADLSFFQACAGVSPRVQRQSFSFDRNIIEGAMYPSLGELVGEMPGKQALLTVNMHGPGGAALHDISRMLSKREGKWQLAGEVIYNPEDQPDRYDILAPNDIALMEFSGPGAPEAVKVVLLAAAHPEDASTHAAFASAFPGGSMTLLSEEQMQQTILKGSPPADHPIRDWLDKDLLEDVGRGGGESTHRLSAKGGGRGISPDDLKSAKTSAEKIGLAGEELLDYHFVTSPGAGVISHEWVAKVNAIAPYDFLLNHVDGTRSHLDAKSTAGPFANPIHLSLGEMRHATSSGVPYHLYRLYNVTESGATFRIARNIAGRVAPIIDALKALPEGVKVDSLSFDPNYFEFEPHESTIEHHEDAD